MGARVVNPFSLNEMRRLREAVAARPATFRPDAEARARVCRNLWGKTSADDSRAFAAREMAEQRERAAERWGFDFLREAPRSRGAGAQRYEWTRVRLSSVPSAYKMPPLVLDRVLETARATVPTARQAPVLAPSVAAAGPPAQALPDLISSTTAAATNTTTSAPDCTASHAPVAPPRKRLMTDYLQCRKRTQSAVKHEENPAKRRKAEETSLV